MAINLSSLFNNQNINPNPKAEVNGEGNKAQTNNLSNEINNLKEVITSDITKNSGITMLKNMLVGDTFTGKITNINNNAISILLNSNTTINATLKGDVSLTRGSVVTFMVEDNNNGQIQIKPLTKDVQADAVVNKALEAANLPVNEKNINIVKELLNLNMPINAKQITELAKQWARYPDTNINTLANLNRLNIPINKENIGQFEAYKQFDAKLEKSLEKFESNLIEDLNTILNESDNNKGQTSKTTNTTDTNFSNIENPEIIKSNPETQASKMLKSVVNNLYNDPTNEIKQKPIKELIDKKDIEALINTVDNKELKAELKKGDVNIKDFFTKLLENGNLNKDDLSKLINHKGFKELFHEMINETMKLSPREFQESEEQIKNFYKRIKKNIEGIENETKENITPNFNKTVTSIKENINFMNELNKNLLFMQMPIKFSDSEGNGELYVFTNKKNVAYDPDNITALLHLDMEHLGPVDIFVKLTNGTNLNTNFVLESDEMLDFVYSNIDKLEKRLSDLGYETHFEMKVSTPDDEPFDFVRDFIEKDVNKDNSFGQYIFDIKA
ncbi:flagellar hook-length control protein FliK [Lachnospira multipara]|uniref:flagellar hook-length control protein FliK n=1 Tax=Lachnospira multipara TaxID=28051 RepID=UPI00047F66A6|nr:flagellar hook-length control protein FliK [Lachnospira multipara]